MVFTFNATVADEIKIIYRLIYSYFLVRFNSWRHLVNQFLILSATDKQYSLPILWYAIVRRKGNLTAIDNFDEFDNSSFDVDEFREMIKLYSFTLDETFDIIRNYAKNHQSEKAWSSATSILIFVRIQFLTNEEADLSSIRLRYVKKAGMLD